MKFIKTSIQEYLKEQQNNNHNLNENFKRWFGNSKVIYNGKPIPVYHGSSEEFDEFLECAFFTPDYFNAEGYSNEGNVYEVYLSIKNPLVIDANHKKWNDIETEYGTSTIEVVANVDKNKYDGIIFINIKDSWIDDADYQDSDTIYVTFKPNQIKSVDNDGTWDSDDNNIYS